MVRPALVSIQDGKSGITGRSGDGCGGVGPRLRRSRRRLLMTGRTSRGKAEVRVEPSRAPAVGRYRLTSFVLSR